MKRILFLIAAIAAAVFLIRYFRRRVAAGSLPATGGGATAATPAHTDQAVSVPSAYGAGQP